MALKITHRREEDVPGVQSPTKLSTELHQLEHEMRALGTGMVLEIEVGSERAVRGTKAMITRAAKRIGVPFMHWHSGVTVFAKPLPPAMQGRKRRAEIRSNVMTDQQHVHPTDQQDRRGRHPR